MFIYILIHLTIGLLTYRFIRKTIRKTEIYDGYDRIVNLTFSILFSWVWFTIFYILVIINPAHEEKPVKW